MSTPLPPDPSDWVSDVALKWLHREARAVSVDGPGDDGERDAEFGFNITRSEDYLRSRGALRIASEHGTMFMKLAMQFKLKPGFELSRADVARFARDVASPLTVSYFRGAVATECQIMDWPTIILPPQLEKSVADFPDDDLVEE